MKKLGTFLAVLMFMAGCARASSSRVFSTAPGPAAPEVIASKEAKIEFDQGVKAYKAKEFPLAQEHFQNVTLIDPNIPEAYLDLALSLYQQGKVDEAKKQMTEASTLFEKQAEGMGSGPTTP